MKTVKVNAGVSYDVIIGKGLLSDCGKYISEITKAKKICLVCDDTVDALYSRDTINSLESAGFSVCKFVFEHGEKSKNATVFLSLLNFLAEKHLSRSDLLVALGGGVVGDLTGFAAACYLRGVDFVQIPTTLLAAVDSSVGGKTAIDIEAGKNLVGAFHQPRLVICDTNTLSTLDRDIYRDGCAEILKYGMVYDKDFLEKLKTRHVSEWEEEVITHCVEIKRDVVSEDEFDRGARALLNFGHTAGHALEAISRFEISHGAAVAWGMATVTRACEALGICEKGCDKYLRDILVKYGFPLEYDYEPDDLASSALSDKKRTGDTVTLIVPSKIGKCVTKDINTDKLKEIFTLGR